jgi:serine/threonine protein kinase/sugar lactone lactonase YvrE
MPRPGDTISHYKLLSALGKGGMGEVYLAEDLRLERRVAIKILLEDVADDEDRVRRFIQEAKAASALNHPNILTVYEIGDHQDTKYIAAEMIDGETLRDRMKRGGMHVDQAIGIAVQAASALAAAHRSGILHRDIKPENIMVRPDGLVKVLDFGLAKLTEKALPAASADAPTLAHVNTQPGLLVGTLAYMSPEQVRGQKLDGRTDIFSLGTVMYELFTGCFPFSGESHLEVASSILKDDPKPVRQLAPDIPRPLERIIEKSLRKDKDHRYHHIQDLRIDLEDVQDELKFEAKQAVTAADRSIPAAQTERLSLSETISAKRRFTLLHAMVFVAVAALLVGSVWYFRPAATRQPGSYTPHDVASWNSAPGELFTSARFSPDGKMVAFSSTQSGTRNIWVKAGASDPIQVTKDNFSNTSPIWSPAGDELAFLSTRGEDAAAISGIWRVGALGGTPRLIGELNEKGVDLRRWGSSAKIYYQLKNELYSMDIATGQSQKITAFGQKEISWLDIAADEHSIAYCIQTEDGWRAMTGDTSGGAPSQIVSGPGPVDPDGLAWAAEGRRFFYTAPVNGVSQIFLAARGEEKGRQITNSETPSSVADVSFDGRSILVSSTREESNLWRVSLSDGAETTVARDLTMKLWPSISPDDTRVIYQSVKNMSQGDRIFDGGIVVKSVGSRPDERPVSIADAGFLPTWSPDGASVAYIRQLDGVVGLFATSPNGGAERRLDSGGGVEAVGYSVSPYNTTNAAAFAWAPDSKRIAYITKTSGASNLWIADLGQGTRMLTANPDASLILSCPMWSPDGGRLAVGVQSNGQGVGVVSVESGELKVIFRAQGSRRLLGWTPDGQALLVAEPSRQSGLPPNTIIKRVTLADGKETPVADLKNAYYYNMFLSDDRRTIGFAAHNDEKDDLWILPSSGGNPRRITSNSDPALYYSRLAWYHDGSAMVFGKQTRFSLLSTISDID